MHTISLNEAADVLRRSRRHMTTKRARQWLIAGLRCGDLSADATTYYQDCYPVETSPISPSENQAIPMGFWGEVHCERFEESMKYYPYGSLRPSGPYADWENSNFVTSFTQFASVLALRFPNLNCASEGTNPITFTATAIDCTISVMDLELLIGRNPNAIIDRARRKPALHMGNVTKSDRERLLARICAIFLTMADKADIARNPDKLLKTIERTTLWDEASANPDIRVDEAFYRNFANMLAEEAERLYW